MPSIIFSLQNHSDNTIETTLTWIRIRTGGVHTCSCEASLANDLLSQLNPHPEVGYVSCNQRIPVPSQISFHKVIAFEL